MLKSLASIPFDYVTIKTTKSRIGYGFLSIPVSLIDLFPPKAKDILSINDFGKEETKHFTPYTEKSGECRIYRLRFFLTNTKYSVIENNLKEMNGDS